MGIWLLSGCREPLMLNLALWLGGCLPLLLIFKYRKNIPFIGLLGPTAFMILFVAVEIGFRVGPFNSRLQPLSVGRDFVAHRYFFWAPKDMLPKGWTPETNGKPAAEDQAVNFRSGPATMKKAPGVFRIITMGGSNAWGHGIDRYEDTFTALLDQMTKKEFPDRNFEWIAGGVKAFRVFHNLIIYKLLLRHFHPDLIIFYSNVNDGVITHGPYTYHELFTMRTGVDITKLWISENRFPKKESLISAAQSGMRRLRTYNALVQWIRGVRESRGGAGDVFNVSKDANPPDQIEANLRAFVEITRKDGVRLLFADAYQSPEITEVPASRASEVQAIMKKVAREMDVPFLPVNDILHARYEPSALTLSDDAGHINAFGNEQAAKIIFNKLVEDDLLSAPAQ